MVSQAVGAKIVRTLAQRGALRAHIKINIWLHQDDIVTATNSIQALIPYVDANRSDLQKLLNGYVTSKQQHQHRENGCMADGHANLSTCNTS